MSTINYGSKGRTSNRGRQSGANSSHTSRSGSKRSSTERFLPEGVYGNSRFTHVIYSLVGCVVQVQVKNGCLYEGVFRTISPEMNVVLELAHKIEDSRCSSIPSKDRLIEKLIFGKDDVVSLNAANVDLDYAVKDTFTDTAISRFNGQSYDREVRELQPWEGDTGDDISLMENDSSNGWDPNDMFKTNAEQFSVKSTYDENLPQYTTQLEKKDTKEYKQREEEAARIAKEIERSEEYKARIDLENGDGEEEAKFSAVLRPSEMRAQAGNGSGKYIPPHNRRGNTGMPPRRTVSDHSGQQRQISPHKTQLPASVQHLHQTSAINFALGSKDEHIPPNISANINGDKDQKQIEPVVNKSSPEPASIVTVSGGGLSQQHSPVTVTAGDNSTSPQSDSVTSSNKGDRRNPNPRGRTIADLKEFGENFKLTEELKEKRASEKSDEKHPEDETKDDLKPNIAERSKLNPMAREFFPTGQSRSQKPVPQTPTPPRPQTQSPVVQPIVPMYSSLILPSNMVPVGPPQTAQTQGNRYPKRAVVSVQPRQDFSAAAQHATGQPLLANATVQTQQYLPYPIMQSAVMHQQTAAGYQVMPVSANPQRMMNQAPVAASSHPAAGLDPAQGSAQHAHAAPHLFMPTGHGPMPAHMTPHHGQQISHPQPAHVGTHPVAGNPQSQGQMTPVSGPHPAPSPVQHTGPGGQQHHPQGPPTSGTPQPPINYQQIGLQGHHQIQAASHNPASPQAAMHPVSLPYAFTSHPHIQQGAQQFTFTQAAQQQTSVSQTVHTHTHSPHMPQPQIVVMPQPPPHSQVQHTHHVPPHPQFQHSAHAHAHAAAAAAGHHMPAGPNPVHGQGHHMMHHSGLPAIPVSAPSGVHPSPVHHFVSPVPSHGPGGPVQTGYPQAQ
ncbi:ataxin-2-like protein isoform X1 [Haliotis cracherodii]|uniref:ataxin-2-like protein isoform X1 n=1 Tax=Haliotis cracherodii TaxID=6455 RepID=UPI0039E953A1